MEKTLPILAGLCLCALACLGSCRAEQPDLIGISGKARNLLELESCEYVYHDIVYQGRNEKVLGLVTTRDTRLLFSIDITISAGIDLRDSTAYRIETIPATDGGLPGLRVRLPPAVILRTDADEASIHQYFIHEYGFGEGGKVNWLDFQDEISAAKQRAREDAVKRGLLVKARDNAGQRLAAFFRLAGFGEVSIETTEPAVLPAEAAPPAEAAKP